jgi:hypothetical protein
MEGKGFSAAWKKGAFNNLKTNASYRPMLTSGVQVSGIKNKELGIRNRANICRIFS